MESRKDNGEGRRESVVQQIKVQRDRETGRQAGREEGGWGRTLVSEVIGIKANQQLETRQT